MIGQNEQPSIRQVKDLFTLDDSHQSNNNRKKCVSYSSSTTLDNVIDEAYSKNNEMYSLTQLVRGHKQPPKKRQKTSDFRPVVIVRFNTRRGKAKPETLRALLDSGGSSSLITEKFTKKLKLRTDKTKGKTTWSTPAGTLTTNSTVRS